MNSNATNSSPGSRFSAWVNRGPLWQIAIVALSPVVGFWACCVLYLVLPGSEFVSPPVHAPEGDFVAQIRESNHGALDTFHTDVHVTDESVNRGLFSSGRKTRVFYGTVHPCTVILTWESANHLVVAYPPGSRYAREYSPDWPDLTVTFVQERPDEELIQEAFGVESSADCHSTYFHPRKSIFRILFDRLAGE